MKCKDCFIEGKKFDWGSFGLVLFVFGYLILIGIIYCSAILDTVESEFLQGFGIGITILILLYIFSLAFKHFKLPGSLWDETEIKVICKRERK